MRITRFLAANFIFAALAYGAFADTLVLKNGDHLTGTIESSDAKEITLKTDYAGEIKVQWSAVKETTTDKTLYVVKTDKATVNGTVTAEDSNRHGSHCECRGRDGSALQCGHHSLARPAASLRTQLASRLVRRLEGRRESGIRPGSRQQRHHEPGRRLQCRSKNQLRRNQDVFVVDLFHHRDARLSHDSKRNYRRHSLRQKYQSHAVRVRQRRFRAQRASGPGHTANLHGRARRAPDQSPEHEFGRARRRELHAGNVQRRDDGGRPER